MINGRGDVKAGDSYIEKTSKLIPGEALALFLAISGQVWGASVPQPTKQTIVLYAAFFVGLVVVPFFLWRLQKVRSVCQHVISVVAFALWVFNSQYERLPSISPYDSLNLAVGSLLLLIFTFMAPFLLPEKKGEN